MDEDHYLEIGDDAVHGKEAYALWGDGKSHPSPLRFEMTPNFFFISRHYGMNPEMLTEHDDNW